MRAALPVTVATVVLGTLSGARSEETVEYTAADGTKKTLSMEDAERKLKEQEDFLKNARPVDGGFEKSESGTVSREEIEKENPEMALFLKKGEAAVALLRQAGHVPEDVVPARMSSGKMPADLKPTPEDRARPGFFRNAIVVTVKSETQERTFEVVLERDPKRLPPPSIHLLRAWSVVNGERVSELAVPTLEYLNSFESWIRTNMQPISIVLGVILFSAVVRFIRIFVERFVMKKGEKAEEPDAKEDTAVAVKKGGRKASKGARKRRHG